MGYQRSEEVDYVPRLTGGLLNFGWSYYEGKTRQRTGAKALSKRGRLVAPLHVYGHQRGDCSITGGYVYRGTGVPELEGRYLFGDFCSGRIWSLRVSGGRATDVRLEPARLRLIVSFGEDADGELYTVSLAGRVYRLTAG